MSPHSNSNGLKFDSVRTRMIAMAVSLRKRTLLAQSKLAGGSGMYDDQKGE